LRTFWIVLAIGIYTVICGLNVVATATWRSGGGLGGGTDNEIGEGRFGVNLNWMS
jgi:hypothetical protein